MALAASLTCPRCATAMRLTVRQDVEIDFCPACLGVWLDRGEIERIVNRLAVGDPDGFPYLLEPGLDDLTDTAR